MSGTGSDGTATGHYMSLHPAVLSLLPFFCPGFPGSSRPWTDPMQIQMLQVSKHIPGFRHFLSHPGCEHAEVSINTGIVFPVLFQRGPCPACIQVECKAHCFTRRLTGGGTQDKDITDRIIHVCRCISDLPVSDLPSILCSKFQHVAEKGSLVYRNKPAAGNTGHQRYAPAGFLDDYMELFHVRQFHGNVKSRCKRALGEVFLFQQAGAVQKPAKRRIGRFTNR